MAGGTRPETARARWRQKAAVKLALVYAGGLNIDAPLDTFLYAKQLHTRDDTPLQKSCQCNERRRDSEVRGRPLTASGPEGTDVKYMT